MTNILLFDLDSTLYPKDCGFEASRQTAKVFAALKGCSTEEAVSLYKHYAEKYGAAPFTGIYKESGICMETFINKGFMQPQLNLIPKNPQLNALLKGTGKRCVVFSNVPEESITPILQHLNIEDCFEKVIGTRALNYICKPHEDAFKTVLQNIQATGQDCTMVEDTIGNLHQAKALGMKTAFIHPEAPSDTHHPHFTSINDFLKSIQACPSGK